MTIWQPEEPGPRAGTTVWSIDLVLPDDELRRCEDSLSVDERLRMSRFVRAEDRARYAASHAALRLILGRALGQDPLGLAFTVAQGGRPELAGGELSFNLSHSGPYALIAVSTEATVGIDVEVMRPLPDALRIAGSHFAPDEVAALAGLAGPAREAAFFGLWTRKEAVVKALGAGLALPLSRFSVSVPPAEPRLLRLDVPAPVLAAWSLHHIHLGRHTVGALAAAGPVQSLARFRLPARWPALLGRAR